MKPIHYTTLFKLPDTSRKVPIDFLYRILSGTPVPVSIGALFKLWNDPMFQSKCDCGGTGFVVSFCGSPLSGCYGALVRCPHCGKNFQVGKYGDAHKLLQNARFGELVNKVYFAQRKSEMPDENTFLFETLVGELRRKAFFENHREAAGRNNKGTRETQKSSGRISRSFRASGRTRTCNLLVRSQLRYPVTPHSHWGIPNIEL